jgi:hypothetical protein
LPQRTGGIPKVIIPNFKKEEKILNNELFFSYFLFPETTAAGFKCLNLGY